MKKLLLLPILFLLSSFVLAQPGPQQFVFNSPVPNALGQLSSQVVGAGGNTTYYYYIITNYPIGSISSAPFAVRNANATLTGGNYIQLNWLGLTGATSYTIIRASTPNLFINGVGTCINCVVVQNLTAVTYNDTTASLSVGYTLNTPPSSSVQFFLNNRDYSTPQLVVSTIAGPTATFNLLNPVSFGSLANGNTQCLGVNAVGLVIAFGCTSGGSVTNASALTLNLPVIGQGGNAIAVGSVTGNTTKFATFNGAATASRCIDTDASGNLQITAADCSTVASFAFSAITSATNITATMTVGTGASITPSGSGIVNANQLNGTAFLGTNGDLVGFGASNIPTDTGILATNIVNKATSNTGATGFALNMAASTSAAAFRLPNIAGASSTTAGVISYDTTNKNLHAGGNGVDNFVGLIPSASPPVSGNCAKFIITAGVLTLVDASTTCGGSATAALSTITAAAGANTIASGDNAQIWNWALTTANKVAFTFGETSAATSSGISYLVKLVTLAGSTATPLNLTDSLTGSQVLPTLSITPTWNTSGIVDAALLISVTNTASGTGSKLLDLKVGGTSEFNVDKTGLATALAGLSTGTNAPAVTCGTGGCIGFAEGTAEVTCVNTNVDCIHADSTAHAFKVSYNGGTAYAITQTIQSGTVALGTSLITSGSCATLVTASATGTLSTDIIIVTPNASIKAVTGFTASTNGGLSISWYPTADTINVDVCNWANASVTPGAVSLNYRVVR